METVSQAGALRSFTERRPRVMLEWDSALNKVVAPRSQVGISLSQTSAGSRKGSRSHSQARLVDGFGIPPELSELPDLNDILSVETWDNCLTQSEREILSMYLPEGVDPGSTVEALLSGRNFHFGNPLQTWGESVCAGTMHPDAILHRDLEIKEQQKAYSKMLRSYHDNMVQNVQNMKEIWEECENPEDFLPQIRRFGSSGSRTQGRHIKNVFHPHKKAVENADLRKRDWREVGEVDLARDIPTRPKAKKQKVSKVSEEGPKRLKIKPAEFEMEKVKTKPSGGPNRLKVKPTGLKGGKVGQPAEGATTLKMNASEVGTPRLKIKSPEGAKGLEIKPLVEGRKKGQSKPLKEETRRPKKKPTEGARDALQMKHGDDAVKREMKMSDEGLKGQKTRPSSEVVGRLKIKLSGDGRKKLEIKPADEGPKRLKTMPLDDRKDLALRLTAKRSTEEGAKILDSEHAEEGTKKSQIELSEAGRMSQHSRSLEEERDPASRSNAKRRKVKPSEEERALRPKTKISEGGSEISEEMKPSREGQKLRKMKPSGETTETLQIWAPREGKGLKLESLEGAQRPNMKPTEEKDLLSRQRRSKVKPGTKKLKSERTEEEQEQEDVDLGHSDLEGEWFKKYVQVTVGPLSGQRLSKAMQSVEVTAEMFKDVKRRSEAGEEVHLDTLVPIKAPSTNIKAFKNATASSSNEEDIIASFWRTVLIKDLPAVHVRFMQRREQLRKVATSLASSCKNLWEIELPIICDGPSSSSEQSLQHSSLSPIPTTMAL